MGDRLENGFLTEGPKEYCRSALGKLIDWGRVVAMQGGFRCEP